LGALDSSFWLMVVSFALVIPWVMSLFFFRAPYASGVIFVVLMWVLVSRLCALTFLGLFVKMFFLSALVLYSAEGPLPAL